LQQQTLINFIQTRRGVKILFLTAGGSIDPSSCQMTTMKHQHQQKTVAKKACAR
jgi:hypothetical protein